MSQTIDISTVLDVIPNADLEEYVREFHSPEDIYTQLELEAAIERVSDGDSQIVESKHLEALCRQLDRIKHKQAFSTWDAAQELEKLIEICEDLV